jgi:predicted nucleic acid-binding Zn ribbon protein
MAKDKHRKREMQLNGMLLIALLLLVFLFLMIIYPAIERIFND